MQFTMTRAAVLRRANGRDPEPPLGAHEHESRGDRREHPLCRIGFVILAVTPIAGHGGEGDRRARLPP